MMELDIMMQGAPAGKLQMEQDGLFLHFRCTLRSAPEAPLRLYAISGWHSEYLGIPYPQNGTAQLEARLPASHFPQLPEYAVADTQPRGAWEPWCGRLDGVPVWQCRLRTGGDGLEIALPPEEAQLFPAWLPHMQERTLFGEPTLILHLNADGTPPFSPEEPLPEPEAENAPQPAENDAE